MAFSDREGRGLFLYSCRERCHTVNERPGIDSDEPPDFEEIAGILDDEYARAILRETSAEAMSANELSDRCDASLPTVYRRLDRLESHDLVAERTELDPDGNHYSVYEARLDRVEIQLDDGEFVFEIDYREDIADKFTRMWEGIR